jgi:hypothetical protein
LAAVLRHAPLLVEALRVARAVDAPVERPFAL